MNQNLEYKQLKGQRVLVDTNILIYQLNGKYDFTEDLLSADSLFISAMTIAELFAGAPQSQLIELRDYLAEFTVVPVSEEIATLAGALKTSLPKHGLKDLIIAATAQINKFRLFTANKKDFKGVTSLKSVYAEI